MRRTTEKDLERLATIINNLLGTDEKTAYTVGYAYGQPELVADRESRNVIPRCSRPALAARMRSFIEGIEAARRIER